MKEAEKLVELKRSHYVVLHRHIGRLLDSYNMLKNLLLVSIALSPIIILIYWLTTENHSDFRKILWAFGIFVITASYLFWLRISAGKKYNELLSVKKDLEAAGFRIWVTGFSPFSNGDILKVLPESEIPGEGKMIPVGARITLQQYNKLMEA